MCPTSVMFMIWVTRKPSNIRARRIRSASIWLRRFPRWAYRYTVGPHVYIVTWPSSMGTTSSIRRVSVLYSRMGPI